MAPRIRVNSLARKTLAIKVPYGLLSVKDLEKEIDEMASVLLGHTPPPIDTGISTMMEVAEGYYARCAELTRLILREESNGTIVKGSPYYKLRTGELRLMLELCSRLANLGSRRITADELRFKKTTYGRESYRS
jgi:hypothetical protein